MTEAERVVDIDVRGSGLDYDFLAVALKEAKSQRLCGSFRASEDATTLTIHLEGMGYQIDSFLDWLRSNSRGQIFRVDVASGVRENWQSLRVL